MKLHHFFSFSAILVSVLNDSAEATFGGVGRNSVGDVLVGPIYNYRAAHAGIIASLTKDMLIPKGDNSISHSIISNNQTVWSDPSSGQQVVIYSCSSTTCGLSIGYDDVNPGATYVPIGFGMADANGNVDFTPTASVSILNGRAGISFGGSGQSHPEYFLYNIDETVAQIVTLVNKYAVTKIDIDLEQLTSIAPSYMTEFLTALHVALPDVTISVAPECPGVSSAAGAYVEGSGSAYNYWVQILNECPFLLVFIQSYNNWCSPYAYGSYDNLMQILSDWINPNEAIGYNGYNPKQIVLGLCAIEPEKDPTACSFGYATADVVSQTFLSANELYSCSVGGGVWASYCDQANNYLITNTMIDAFNSCNVDGSSMPTVTPSARPSLSPTITQTSSPTYLRTNVPSVSPSVALTFFPTVSPTASPTKNATNDDATHAKDSSLTTQEIIVGASIFGLAGIVATVFGIKKYYDAQTPAAKKYVALDS